MKRAYSLIRFSSWRQAKGESRRRQLEWGPAWCERHNYHLDDALHQDRPVSAFRGRQRIKGALAAFLDMVQVGRVPKGSCLLVESLDRLSREQIDEALTLFLGILKAGVDIATMVPERHYTKASVGDLVGLLEPLIIMSRAHEESLVKSARIADVWEQRRARAGTRPMNGVGPAWLRMEGGRWQVDEGKAAAVRLIFRLCIDGHGLHAIAHRLNRPPKEGGVPVIGRAKEWSYSYVGIILRSRSTVGELQPHTKSGKRAPVGKPVTDYYPRIISEADFYKAQAALAARKNQKGPRGQHVRNLFTGLLRDARDGCTVVTVTESDKCRSVRLVSSGAQRGKKGSDYRTFPYPALEGAFLALAKELKAADVQPAGGPSAEDEVTALTGRLQGLDYRIGRVSADLKAGGDFDAGLALLRDLEKDKAEAAAQLEKARALAATGEAEALGEAQTLIGLLAGAEGEELLSLRMRVKQRLREVVSEVWLLVVPRGWDRLAALQVFFTNGRRRDLLILARRGGLWRAASLADVAEAGDLRDRKQARGLEQLLSAIDPEALWAALGG
jgi:DNA invertase Pin-like site-specific DNA recombinase